MAAPTPSQLPVSVRNWAHQIEKPGVDFGAADGKFLLAAAVNGSGHVIGFELPENKVHKMLFDAVVKRIRRKYEVNLDVEWIGQDIEEVPLTMLT